MVMLQVGRLALLLAGDGLMQRRERRFPAAAADAGRDEPPPRRLTPVLGDSLMKRFYIGLPVS